MGIARDLAVDVDEPGAASCFASHRTGSTTSLLVERSLCGSQSSGPHLVLDAS